MTSVRKATQNDAAEIAECLCALGYGTPRDLVEQRLRQLSGSACDAVFVVSDSSGIRLLGVVYAHAWPLFHQPGQIVRLSALAVRDGAQGGGVGAMLVAAVEAWSWQLGARRIEVTSGDHRPLAHAFYQSVGYALEERRFIKHAPGTEHAS